VRVNRLVGVKSAGKTHLGRFLSAKLLGQSLFKRDLIRFNKGLCCSSELTIFEPKNVLDFWPTCAIIEPGFAFFVFVEQGAVVSAIAPLFAPE